MKKAPAKTPAKKSAIKNITAANPAANSVAKTAAKSTKKSAALLQSELLQKTILHSLDENKAEDVVSINLAGKASFADALIVASGRSSRHIAALADHISDAIRAKGFIPPIIEGKESPDWVLLDAGDVVVHLFRPEIRQMYNLEKMWSMPAAPDRV